MKKKILALLFAILTCVLLVFPVAADTSAEGPFVIDEANILSEKEASDLANHLGQISADHNMQVMVVTVNSLEGDPNSYAESYYDYYNFGYGPNHDGVMFLISMGTRDWVVSAKGAGQAAFTAAGREYLGKHVKKLLSKGNYYDAFEKFADFSEDYITKYEDGNPYRSGHLPFDTSRMPLYAIGSILVAFIISLIVTGVMKAHLKSVRPQDTAKYYVRPGSLNITNGFECFLYRTVTSHKIESSSSSGGGSSSSRSSSGKF